MEYDRDYANLLQQVEGLSKGLAAARRMSKRWKELARRWHYIALPGLTQAKRSLGIKTKEDS